MSEIWHSRYTMPVRSVDPILIEVELISGKTGIFYTDGEWLRYASNLEYEMGWMWVNKWRYIFDEEDVKESSL